MPRVLDDKSQTKQVLVRMPADLHEAIKHQADTEDRTMAAVIRRAARRYLTDDA